VYVALKNKKKIFPVRRYVDSARLIQIPINRSDNHTKQFCVCTNFGPLHHENPHELLKKRTSEMPPIGLSVILSSLRANFENCAWIMIKLRNRNKMGDQKVSGIWPYFILESILLNEILCAKLLALFF